MNSRTRALAEILSKHNYSLIKSVGRGMFGEVYLVNSQKYNVQFVVKIFPCEGESIEQEGEISSLMKLLHPNIVNIYEFWRTGNEIFLVIEYCDKGNLQEFVNKNGPISVDRLRVYFKQLLNGLAFFHSKGISHNDIKE